MKQILYMILFLTVFGFSLYFFILNSSQRITVFLWKDVMIQDLPSGLVILFAFFLGFVAGSIFFYMANLLRRII